MAALLQLPLFPEAASHNAEAVDALFTFLCAFSAGLSLLIIVLIITFSIKYRRRAPNEIGAATSSSLRLEMAWTIGPFIIAMILFSWGTRVYFLQRQVPADPIDIYGIGKQWMWKLQHLEGMVEINELHVPVDRDIRVILTSEDVIHDFFVPAFRNKADVLPDRYSVVTFRASKTGDFRLHCAEYCGTNHSLMGGWIHVMAQSDYEQWLADHAGEPPTAQAGAALWERFECTSCHSEQAVAEGRGPSLRNLFGSRVRLANGDTVLADENYLLRSILRPHVEIVAGYGSTMPSYAGQMKGEELARLVVYIKSLSSAAVRGGAAPAPHGPAAMPARQGEAP